jgi:hypothetical protein
MTTSPVRNSLLLSSPDAIVAALPYLVGFVPRESLTAVWIAGRRIILTQRLDLEGRTADACAWTDALWEHPAARAADQLIAVISTASEPPDDLLGQLRDTSTHRAVRLRDVLVAHEGRWRSALCADRLCCPEQGRALDPRIQAEVAAEFTVMGAAPLPGREDVVRSLARDTAAAARIARLMGPRAGGPSRGRRAMEEWRDATIEVILARLFPRDRPGRIDSVAPDGEVPDGHVPDGRVLDGRVLDGGVPDGDIPDAEVARIVGGMADVRVRDTVLWHLASKDSRSLQLCLAVLATCVRAAPDGYEAPIATACAVSAWLLGDGARAAIAVQRALQARPEYTLAQLVACSLGSGLPPATWRSAMQTVTLEECRHGTNRVEQRAG